MRSLLRHFLTLCILFSLSSYIFIVRRHGVSEIPEFDAFKWENGWAVQVATTKSSNRQQTFPTNSSLSHVCKTFPGYGEVEGGLMGYQVFLRMKSFLPEYGKFVGGQEETLLCIWFANRQEPEIDQTATRTFGTECDGILLINEENTASRSSSGSTTHVMRVNTTEKDWLTNVFDHVTVGLGAQYHWFHWTDPQQYYVIPRHIHRIISLSPKDSVPVAIQPWKMNDPSGNSKYHELFGTKPSSGESCDLSRTGNRRLAQVFRDCSNQSPLDSSLEGIQRWMSLCSQTRPVRCQQAPHDRSKRWQFLGRYSEVELPRRAKAVSSLERIHTMLFGGCDSTWYVSPGARDEQGRGGYVHDATYLRKNPPPFPKDRFRDVCSIPFGEGDEGRLGIKALRKVRVSENPSPVKEVRVLCMIYTHSGGHERVRSIAETWGPECDGFFAASNLTDRSIGAVDLLHWGPETYNNMWSKVVAMWMYAYDHFLHDYDIFHIGGDDHFLIPANLREMTVQGSWRGPWNLSLPLYLGGSLAINEKRRYCNGGSGYTLNRVALKLLVADLIKTPACMPHWHTPMEDRMISSCFRSVGIQCIDTNDGRNESRYHPWTAHEHWNWHIGLPAQKWRVLRESHGIAWLEGSGQISESSVSFHLKSPKVNSTDRGMRRYYAILNSGVC